MATEWQVYVILKPIDGSEEAWAELREWTDKVPGTILLEDPEEPALMQLYRAADGGEAIAMAADEFENLWKRITGIRAWQVDGDLLQEATEDDLKIAVDNALRRAGCTAKELIAQAKSGRFNSIPERLAWVAIGDLLYSKEE